MENIKEYNIRLDNCIQRTKDIMYERDDWDQELLNFLEELKYLRRPIQYHSCDDPDCIICG